ncbi:Chitin synthase 4 [Microbotryomycetes sp. JL201]|nr:Chitin synthase 4 [Microbotryomycetes sp. JL201]
MQGAAFAQHSSQRPPVVDEFAQQARASVLHRPRPKPSSASQRPSSFFGAVDDAIAHSDRYGTRQGDGGHAPHSVSNGSGAGASGRLPLDMNAAAFEATHLSRPSRVESGYSESGQFADAQPEGRSSGERRSSFFGGGAGGDVDAAGAATNNSVIAPIYNSQLQTREPSPVPAEYAPSSRAQTPSSNHHSSVRNIHHSAGESSGSFSSSHDTHNRASTAAAAAARFYYGGGATGTPTQQQAPSGAINGSRAPSVYGGASTSGEQSASAAPLLDQSHLQPGGLATLLSHEKTLELYRANAKKTNDPDIQFDFCTFVMEIVGEMEAAEEREYANRRRRPSTDAENAAKQKQQALVAESVAILNKLANRGHVKSQYFLADCYTQGIGTPKGKRDYDKAFPLFVLAGKHGHSDACFRAAQCFENGWGCKRDHSRAVQLLRRAAVLNHPGAMHRLGVAEINGELGLSRRPREGVRWLKRAAELADQVDPPQPQSLHELALLHEKGIENVIFQDEEYAAELLARASELQYPPSAYKLGECYEYGKMGCPQDAALSIHYYNIAAQQNHREACFALTAWYLVGSPGVLPQSDTEAYLWARRAAEMELAKAEYAVGYFTEASRSAFLRPSILV